MVLGVVLVGCLFIFGADSWDLTPVNDAIKACAKDQGISDAATGKLVDIVAKYVDSFKEGDDQKALQDNVKKDSEIVLKDDGQEGKFADLGSCITAKLTPKARR